MSLLSRRFFLPDEPEIARNPGSGVPCTVYLLKSSGDLQARYIGQTSESLAKRLVGHLSANSDSPVGRWMRRERAAGNAIEIIGLVPEGKAVWNETEVKAIAAFRAIGVELLNVADGGGAREGYEIRPVSAGTRAKMSALRRGRRLTPEHRAKIAAGLAHTKGRGKIERF